VPARTNSGSLNEVKQPTPPHQRHYTTTSKYTFRASAVSNFIQENPFP